VDLRREGEDNNAKSPKIVDTNIKISPK